MSPKENENINKIENPTMQIDSNINLLNNFPSVINDSFRQGNNPNFGIKRNFMQLNTGNSQKYQNNNNYNNQSNNNFNNQNYLSTYHAFQPLGNYNLYNNEFNSPNNHINYRYQQFENMNNFNYEKFNNFGNSYGENNIELNNNNYNSLSIPSNGNKKSIPFQNNFNTSNNFKDINNNTRENHLVNNDKNPNNFSQALINNKLFSEDNHILKQVSQSKKPSKISNLREGLFDKNENSTANILKNNFCKGLISEEKNKTYKNSNKSNDDYSEIDENQKEKNDTDEDPEEIRIVDEALQKYIDEEKVINDKKLKVSVIRKVAPHYKVLTQPNNDNHFNDILDKIKNIINEEKTDILFLLNYEYLKCLREKVFQKFCKMINKFFVKLTENKVKEFGGDNYHLEIPDILKERLKNIYTKINDYFDKNKDLEYFNF